MALTKTRVQEAHKAIAITKAKRSVRKKQSAVSIQQSVKPKKKSTHNLSTFVLPKTRLTHFRELQGKTVEDVVFSTAPDHQDITIKLQDKTGLSFSIATGLILKTEYSRLDIRRAAHPPPLAAKVSFLTSIADRTLGGACYLFPEF